MALCIHGDGITCEQIIKSKTAPRLVSEAGALFCAGGTPDKGKRRLQTAFPRLYLHLLKSCVIVAKNGEIRVSTYRMQG